MRSFLVVLGVVLAFPTVAPDAQEALPLGSLSAEDAAGFGSLTLIPDRSRKGPSFCAGFDGFSKLKKGMTYEEVRDLMGCDPKLAWSVPYGDGTATKTWYDWPAGKDRIETSFIDGRLSDSTGVIIDSFGPGFDPYEGQRAEFLRRWLDIRRKETE
jgi:hypothetical protein